MITLGTSDYFVYSLIYIQSDYFEDRFQSMYM